jgi:PAS domain S-box-containing protein
MQSATPQSPSAPDPAQAFQRRARQDVDRQAARWGAAMIAAQGLLIIALSLLANRTPDDLALQPFRMALGGSMLLAAGLGALLARGPRPQWGVMLMLTLTLLSLHGMALGSQQGLQSLPLAGSCLLLALAAGILGLRASLLLGVLHAAVLAGLCAMHLQASPLLAPITRTAPSLLLAQGILAMTGLLTGWMLLRLFALALHRSTADKHRLAELLRIGADWTFTLNARGELIELSDSFAQHTGVSAAEFLRLGQPGGPVLVADEGAAELRQALAQRHAFRHLAVQYERANGQRLAIRASGEPLHDEAGRVTGWWGTCRHVTAELAAARELARAKALLERLVNGSPDPIVVAYLDDGRILMANEAFCRLTGVPMAETLGRTAYGLGLWPDLDNQRVLREAVMARGQARNHRTELWCRDGQRRQMLINAGHFMWDERPAVTFSGRDVTAQLLAEAELAATREQAEAASRAKSAFLATMSHEIRTPLNGVLGLARLLREDRSAPPERREEWLGLLLQSAEGLSGIVSDVLDLSKIEAGRLVLEQAPVQLPELLHSAFNGFAALGRERGLDMQLQLSPAVPVWVQADAVRLRQILSNLLHNALKFTAQGRVQLAVAWTPRSGLVLDVVDTGIGVPQEAQARLFQPFAQADGSTTRRFGGSGLGLSICAELVQLMAGTISVHSDGRHGSRFRVQLPLEATAAPAAMPADGASAAPLQGLCVLVADDNAVNMLIVRALLERLGAQVLAAEDGQQAVDMALQHAATLGAVLMDLHMPVLDGLSATRRLAADPRLARLPVIALSAAVLNTDREQARAAGMCDFVAKPVSSDELLRALRPFC